MTYEEIVAKVKKHFQSYQPASKDAQVAVQFDITGEGEGAFYVEIADGKIAVEPYEYYEHDIKIVAEADALMEIVSGKTDIVNANLTGRIYAEGNLEKAEIFSKLEKKAAKTAAAGKPAAKKAPAKKPAAKKTTAAKKPAAKKTTTAKKSTK
ncbi:MAG: SCP2 sterol-binding domain-containing protein [Lachnospiraceae bacterium]|nr:SCP2 sterol-binding domain-containing protein [Lachnospiraceae bacterium]